MLTKCIYADIIKLIFLNFQYLPDTELLKCIAKIYV